MKHKPMLQIALDTFTTEEALVDIKKVASDVDVIEIGTILIAAVGKTAVEKIARQHPDKLIVADGKIADAGTVFGNMFFGSGATYTTVICAAETATIKAVLDVARDYGSDRDVQVELTSHYTPAQVASWKAIGVQQVVYHRSRDAQAAGASWRPADINAVRDLAQAGFKVTVTGGMIPADIKLFRGIPVHIFIAGRALRDAPDPLQVARMFQAEIRKYW